MAALGLVEELMPGGQQTRHKGSREPLDQHPDRPCKSSLFLRLFLIAMTAIVLRLIPRMIDGELCYRSNGCDTQRGLSADPLLGRATQLLWPSRSGQSHIPYSISGQCCSGSRDDLGH